MTLYLYCVAPVLVPDVVNQTQAAAEAAIVAATLTVGNVTTAQSDTVPAGSVISQNPARWCECTAGHRGGAAGRIARRIAGAGARCGGSGASGGWSAIVAATLKVGNVTTAYSPTVTAGNVISQNPIGGECVAGHAGGPGGLLRR